MKYRVLTVASLAVMAACGSDKKSPPTGINVEVQNQLNAVATQLAEGGSPAAGVVSLAAEMVALGAQPTNVTGTVTPRRAEGGFPLFSGTAATNFQAVGMRFVTDNDPEPGQTTVISGVLYWNGDVSQLIMALNDGLSTTFGTDQNGDSFGFVTATDPVQLWLATAGSMTANFVSGGGACSGFQSVAFEGGSCQVVKMNSALSISGSEGLPINDVAPPGSPTASFATAQINGVQIEVDASAGASAASSPLLQLLQQLRHR